MGVFDWIFGAKGNVELDDDMIWLSKRAKFAGIGLAVDQCFALGEPPIAVILVAHFDDCLAELQAVDSFEGPVTATLAGDLAKVTVPEAALSENHLVRIIVAERHPLPKHDEAVLDFARNLPCRCHVGFHLSLEDCLLKSFAGEWVESLLKQLGMNDDEAITSRMVARRIKDAQRKIESRAVSDLRAASAEEWMELNCRAS